MSLSDKVRCAAITIGIAGIGITAGAITVGYLYHSAGWRIFRDQESAQEIRPTLKGQTTNQESLLGYSRIVGRVLEYGDGIQLYFLGGTL